MRKHILHLHIVGGAHYRVSHRGTMDTEEKEKCVKFLLTLSHHYFSHPLLSTVTDSVSEIASGWKLVQPRPVYRCQHTTKTKKKHNKLTSNTPSKTHLHKTLHEYTSTMGGRLTEQFDYIYEGGLSSKVGGAETMHLPSKNHTHSLRHPPRVTLIPVILDRSERLSEQAHQELTNLAQRQLKPDLAYEQMIIEQQLRSIDLHKLQKFKVSTLSQPKPLNHTHQKIPVQSIVKPPSGRGHHVTHSTHKRKGKLKPFDWSVISNYQPPAFKRETYHSSSEPALKTSFSRLLESSSVIFSYKK